MNPSFLSRFHIGVPDLSRLRRNRIISQAAYVGQAYQMLARANENTVQCGAWVNSLMFETTRRICRAACLAGHETSCHAKLAKIAIKNARSATTGSLENAAMLWHSV